MKKLSNNELTEGLGLFYELRNFLENTYCHVPEYVGKTTLTEVLLTLAKLEAEYDRRVGLEEI